MDGSELKIQFNAHFDEHRNCHRNNLLLERAALNRDGKINCLLLLLSCDDDSHRSAQ